MTETPSELREARAVARIPLRAVADKLKISTPYLLDLERGFRRMSPARCKAYRKALRELAAPPRPHIQKVETFKESFLHQLENNEWKEKLPVDHDNGKTYNPDFFCPTLACYIEVATSWSNYSSERIKWAACIDQGYKLRVYWWTGIELTEEVLNGAMPSSIRSKYNLAR